MFRSKHWPTQFLGILFSTILAPPIALAQGPQTFTYQGQLADANGQPVTQNVDLVFQILDPTGNCLLYEEKHAGQNFSSSNGNFSVQVGSVVSNAKRTVNDPNLSMGQIFSNQAQAIRNSGSPNCSAGYTPGANDSRLLRVTVIANGVPDVLSPDQVLAAAPFAVTAQTLQGKQPGDFISNTLSGMQAALESLVNMRTALENLVNGTSTTYVKADGSNLTSALNANNQKITSVATPTAANDAVNKSYADLRLGGLEILAPPTATGQVLSWNSVMNKWEAQPIHNHAKVVAAPCSATEASRWDGTAWTCITAGGGGVGNVVGGGSETHITTTGNVVLTNASAKVQMIDFSEGGRIQLPDATTMSLGGPLFSFFKSSKDAIPVFNSLGNFVGALSAWSLSTDIFLFNKDTVAGDWRARAGNDGFYNWGVEKAVFSNFNMNSASTVSDFKEIAPNTYLLAYLRDGKTWALALSINPSTKIVSWGTPLELPTTTSGMLRAMVPLSSTQVALFYNNGSHIVTLSGLNAVAETYQDTQTCGADASIAYKKISPTLIACVNTNGFAAKFTFESPATLTKEAVTANASISSSNGTPNIIPLGSSAAAVLFTANNSSISANETKAFYLDMTGTPTFTGGNVILSYASGGGYYGPFSYSNALSVDANSFLLADSVQYTQRVLIKVRWDGSQFIVDSNQSLSSGYAWGIRLFTDAGTTYVSYATDYPRPPERRPISNLSAQTPTLGAAEKAHDCQGLPLTKQTCFAVEAFSQSPNDFEFRGLFQIGY